MIHHLSIPVKEPAHVAQVLCEIFDGKVTEFGPYKNSYIAWAGDAHGTAIEVFPVGTELLPDAEAGQARFRYNDDVSGFTATHAAVSVRRSKAEIEAIAAREGWRAIELSRGSFRVIEFWIENRVMLEILTEEMAQEYLQATRVYA